MNLAVGVMFYTVHITPAPVLANSTPQAPVAVQQKPIAATVGIPARVILPSLGIDLPVKTGSYNPNNASWTVDNLHAYYADASMPLNNSNGTTLIYGHAQSSVFATLPQLQPKAKAIVHTDTDYIFTYTHTSAKEVLPSDVSVFSSIGPPTLVLQTCVGTWDEYRALLYFKLISIEKI